MLQDHLICDASSLDAADTMLRDAKLLVAGLDFDRRSEIAQVLFTMPRPLFQRQRRAVLTVKRVLDVRMTRPFATETPNIDVAGLRYEPGRLFIETHVVTRLEFCVSDLDALLRSASD